MRVPVEAVLEGLRCRADPLNLWLAVVLLQRVERAAAARLAIAAGLADKAVAEVCAVGAAGEDVVVLGGLSRL